MSRVCYFAFALLLLTLRFNLSLAAPSAAVPAPSLGSFLQTFLRIPSVCRLTIGSFGSPTSEITDLLQATSKTYTEMGVAFSLLNVNAAQLSSFEFVNPMTPPNRSNYKTVGFEKLLTVETKNTRRFNCAALLFIPSPRQYTNDERFLTDIYSHSFNTEPFWGFDGFSDILMIIDSKPNGSGARTSVNGQQWKPLLPPKPWLVLVLQNWTSLAMSCYRCVEYGSESTFIKIEDEAQLGLTGLRTAHFSGTRDFHGDKIKFLQIEARTTLADRVFENAAVPAICNALNATVMGPLELFYRYIRSKNDPDFPFPVWLTSIRFTGIMKSTDTKTNDGSNFWLRWSEIPETPHFIVIMDQTNRKLSALIEPMDAGTWIGTISSILLMATVATLALKPVKLLATVRDLALGLIGQSDLSRHLLAEMKLRPMLSAWFLASIVISGGYSGVIYTIMTKPTVPSVPETADELIGFSGGDVISNKKYDWGPIMTFKIKTGLTPTDGRWRGIDRLDVSFFHESYDIGRTVGAEKDPDRTDKFRKLMEKQKYIKTNLAGFGKAYMDPEFQLAAAENPVDLKYDSVPFEIPSSYAYVGFENEVRMYRTLLESLGLQLWISDRKPLEFISNREPWWALKTTPAVAVQRKLDQLAEGGFFAQWAAEYASRDAVEGLKELQRDLRREMALESKTAPAAIRNFVTRRNVMVHLFNDFYTTNCVDVTTVNWNVRPLNLNKLKGAFLSYVYLGIVTIGLIVCEMVAASIKFEGV